MRFTWIFSMLMLLGEMYVAAQVAGAGRPGQPDPSTMPKDGYLSGTLVDNTTGEGIEFASVALYRHRDSSLVTGTISRSQGLFELSDLPMGYYYMEVRFVGYRNFRMTRIGISPQKKAIELGPIKLERSLTEIGEVEVVGEKRHMVYQIDRKVVNVSSDLTAAGGTVVDVLENTPSIQTDIDGNVTLRGSSNFTVLVDGKPSVFNGSDALQTISASTVEKIEIITNPSAKFDPDGTAGIINVIMKKQKRRGMNGIVNASAGSFGQYSADALFNFQLEKFNVFTGFDLRDMNIPGYGVSSRQTFLTDTTNFLGAESHEKMGRRSWEFKIGSDYFLNDKNTLTLQADIGSRGFGRSSVSRYHSFTMPSGEERYYIQDNVFDVDHDYYALSFNYDHDFDKQGHELLANAFYARNGGADREELKLTDVDGDWYPVDVLPDLQRSFEHDIRDQFRLKLDYTKPVGEEGRLEAGYQFRYDRGDGDYMYDEYDPVSGEWINVPGRNNDLLFSRNIQGAYVIFGHMLSLFDYQVGLRTEYTNRLLDQIALGEQYRVRRFDLFPSAHILREMKNEQQVQLSYGRRINRPREFDLDPFPHYIDPVTIRIGNPSVEPEFVNSYELNYQKRFRKISLTAELYYRQTSNMISRTQHVNDENMLIYSVDNIGKDYAAGTELMANLDLFKWWKLSGSGTLFRYGIDGEVEGENVDQVTNTWNARLNHFITLPWGTRVQLMGFYSAPSIMAQGDRSDFFMVNAGIRQDLLKRKLTLNFQVRDIFRTMKFASTSTGSNFINYMERSRQSPSFALSLSFKINNYTRRTDNSDMEVELEDTGDF